MSSNDRLRVAFRRLHGKLVGSVNASSVVDYLFAFDVLTDDDNLDIDQITDRRSKCRRLLAILHASDRPDSFIRFREALVEQGAYKWIVEEIDNLCDDGGRLVADIDEVDSGSLSTTFSSNRSSTAATVTFDNRPEVAPGIVRTVVGHSSESDVRLVDVELSSQTNDCELSADVDVSGAEVKVAKCRLAKEPSPSSSLNGEIGEDDVQPRTTERRDNVDSAISLTFLEGETTNEIIRKIVLHMGDGFYNAVDVSMLAERLNSTGVFGTESMSLLTSDVITDPNERCRCLLAVLQTIDQGDAFVKLRDALNEDIAYKWIIDEIDMTCASTVRDTHRPPCKRRAQLMRRHVDDSLLPDDVYGIARLDDRLYVACRRSDAIRTFSANPPYNAIGVWNVGVRGASLVNPCDLVASDEPRPLLYVGDEKGVWVLTVDGKAGPILDRWIRTACRPWSLSIRSGRLLVTPWNDVVEDEMAGSVQLTRLFLYGVDGRLEVSVRLPPHVVPRHAIETSQGTFIVSYYDRYTSRGQVIELDSNRHVINSFDVRHNVLDHCPFLLNPPDIDPSYMTLDSGGNVLVGDSCRRRVVLLDNQLRPAGVLVDRLDSYVYRICHDERNKQLFVGCFKSRSLCVYRLL